MAPLGTLIYGSNGDTGRLIVARAMERGLRPMLAGRNARDEGEANAIIESVAYLEQARVAEAFGHDALARTYYQRFLWRYDKSSEAHRHLVEEARAVLVRLGRSGRRERVR